MEELFIERSDFALGSIHRVDSLFVQSLQVLHTLVALDNELVGAPIILLSFDPAHFFADSHPVVCIRIRRRCHMLRWRVLDNYRAVVNICSLLVRQLADF